jgi:outer membrane lipoprotein SlyB
MPGNLPATGSQISFGRVNQAYTNYTPGTGGNADGNILGSGFGGGNNIRLSSVLGAIAAYGIGQAAGTQIRFSSTFGGRAYPYTY